MMVLLLGQFSAQEERNCQDAVFGINIVKSCPTSIEEWHRSASNKNCTKFADRKNCTNITKRLEYHCLINAFKNETLEVCASARVIFGYCTEFNVGGGVIQRHLTAKCNNVFPKCDKLYNSMDAYKYPDCYKLVYKARASITTVLPPGTKTSYKAEKFARDRKNPFIAALILIILISLIVASSGIIKKVKENTGKGQKNYKKKEVQLEDKKVTAVLCNASRESV